MSKTLLEVPVGKTETLPFREKHSVTLARGKKKGKNYIEFTGSHVEQWSKKLNKADTVKIKNVEFHLCISQFKQRDESNSTRANNRNELHQCHDQTP